jgi:hypothetical protein
VLFSCFDLPVSPGGFSAQSFSYRPSSNPPCSFHCNGLSNFSSLLEEAIRITRTISSPDDTLCSRSRDLEEMMAERGLRVDHTTISRLGSNVMPPNWRSDVGPISTRPRTPGASMRPT